MQFLSIARILLNLLKLQKLTIKQKFNFAFNTVKNYTFELDFYVFLFTVTFKVNNAVKIF